MGRSALEITSTQGRFGNRFLRSFRIWIWFSMEESAPEWPVRSITNITAVGRCCIDASVSASISLRWSSGRLSTPGVSITWHRAAAAAAGG